MPVSELEKNAEQMIRKTSRPSRGPVWDSFTLISDVQNEFANQLAAKIGQHQQAEASQRPADRLVPAPAKLLATPQQYAEHQIKAHFLRQMRYNYCDVDVVSCIQSRPLALLRLGGFFTSTVISSPAWDDIKAKSMKRHRLKSSSASRMVSHCARLPEIRASRKVRFGHDFRAFLRKQKRLQINWLTREPAWQNCRLLRKLLPATLRRECAICKT